MSVAAVNASNELQRIANFARGIVALEEEIRQYGSLAQASAEAKKRLDQLDKEHHRLRDEAKAVKEHIAASKREAADAAAAIIAKARAQEKEIIAKAIRDGEAECHQATADAKARLDELVRQVAEKEAAIADTNEQLGFLNETIDMHRAEHSTIKSKVDTLHAEHARITAEIEAMKARLFGR